MRFVRTTARYIFLSCHTDVLHTPSLSDRPIRFHYSVPFARVCPSSLHHIFKAQEFAPPERIIFSSIALRSYRSFCTFSFLSHICFYGLPCPCRLHSAEFSRRLRAWSVVVRRSEPAACGNPGKQENYPSVKKGCKPKRKKC